MESLNLAYRILFVLTLSGFAAGLAIALFRSVRGPEICDRILAINMIGTLVSASIAVLGAALGEAWLYDISMIYVLIRFLAVAILATVYIHKKKGEDEK